jgi:hypothetical protein
MHWGRRLKHWLYALKLAGASKVPWLGMLQALMSGPVPREVWRQRMRTCMTCPLYSTEQMPGTTKRTDRVHLCRSIHPQMLGVGCQCAVNIVALTADPYGKAGCYGRNLDPELGWPVYVDHRSKLRSLLDFLRGK